ncbi:hypothetical protein EV188_101381 [Actinomycetospora succinea]|uniref:Uncharacterized protein n=1 Tax=Actinomycetospora succinea TaxID=663603 RepID=A0A4R6VMS0_9PSEU|nr:hypothetical protein [Actinomycetospora succinea]TDQ65132.1 hypothetical protein EV188_101381 [Actinomycetospora succinea]
MASHPLDRRFNTRLFLGGAVLAGVGSLFVSVGLALGSVADLEAARRWQRSTEMTPGQLARHAVGVAQAATSAGAHAWQAPMPEGRRSVVSGDGRMQPVP